MEGVLRVQKFYRCLLSGMTDRTALRKKWRWGCAKERWGGSTYRGTGQRGKKGLKNHYVFRDGKDMSWCGMEGSNRWKVFTVRG